MQWTTEKTIEKEKGRRAAPSHLPRSTCTANRRLVNGRKTKKLPLNAVPRSRTGMVTPRLSIHQVDQVSIGSFGKPPNLCGIVSLRTHRLLDEEHKADLCSLVSFGQTLVERAMFRHVFVLLALVELATCSSCWYRSHRPVQRRVSPKRGILAPGRKNSFLKWCIVRFTSLCVYMAAFGVPFVSV